MFYNMKNVLLVSLLFVLYAFTANSQNLEGYTKHETIYVYGGKVSLYYKVTDYGIYFRVYNETDKTVHVKVYDVSSSWSDERSRKRDVSVTYVLSGKTSTGTYENNDNLAKRIGGWNFSGWKVALDRDDLD
jgi:hypothetical protein